jgi:predicted Zn-ribbon and HTH transcriptional regulator
MRGRIVETHFLQKVAEMDEHQIDDTIRRQLIRYLEEDSHGVRELSQTLHQSEKEIYEHLVHVEKTLRSEGKRLVMEPSICLQCGFVFAKRTRTAPPGRCPQCKKTRIRRPRYRIKTEGQ